MKQQLCDIGYIEAIHFWSVMYVYKQRNKESNFLNFSLPFEFFPMTLSHPAFLSICYR